MPAAQLAQFPCLARQQHEFVPQANLSQFPTPPPPTTDPFVAAVGFCYGGWAALRLGAREHHHLHPAHPDQTESPSPLVDCISIAHPSLLTKPDIDAVAVPLQVLAPEHDAVYTPDLKAYTCAVAPRLGVPFAYRHFPGVEHACFCRGDEGRPLERAALVKGKRAVVEWVREFVEVGLRP